jgi:2-oxoglutarate dehydrogenase E1 component
MADLANYSSGGIIHIVANNQIGFTTVPKDGRSGLYSTDIAYTVDAPVFHVNADEPDLVDRVFHLATEFRNKFKKDVVIDVVGYRRYGHNELD